MKSTVFYKDNLGYIHTDRISALKNKDGKQITETMCLFSGRTEMWLVNVETCAMRHLVGPDGLLVGFSDDDIDWTLDNVKQRKQKVISRQIDYGTLEAIKCNLKEGGVMLKWCFHHEYGGAGDCDGFGVEPDRWEYLYIHVGDNCELLSKWTSLESLRSLL